MIRYVAATAMAVALSTVASLPVRAEVLDVSTISCADLADFSEDDGALLMIWLHGYYGGQVGDTTIDLEALGVVAGLVGETCAANPDIGVMTALRQVVGQ